jgi:adenylate kinase family enzyme
MKNFFILIFIILQFDCFGQDKVLITQYPKTIFVKSDSFQIQYSTWKTPLTTKNVENDSIDMGNDAIKNAKYLLIYDNDTLKFNYTNFPFEQKIYIPIEMNGKKFVQILRINQTPAYFSKEYISQNTAKVNFEIPEVYELANIIWTLSPQGQKARNLNKNSKYYSEVYNYFKPFLNHQIFKELSLNVQNYQDSYYDFRENSLSFAFSEDKIIHSEPYFYVMGHNRENFTSLFQKLIPQIEDFAKTCQFREFYRQKTQYYHQSIEEQKKLMPIKKMWSWLENNFDNKFASYKVVYSPLIGATHSTQNFATFLENGQGKFNETVMFVSGPEVFESSKIKDFKLKEGLASGIVFTEIDHNYVNRLSNKYQKQIKNIFDKREIWTGANGDTERYSNPLDVFNEYMTHAIFCLYVKENYDEQTAKSIIKERENLMTETRKYIKFKELNEKLLSLKGDRKVKDLYDDILNWASTVK